MFAIKLTWLSYIFNLGSEEEESESESERVKRKKKWKR